MEKIEDNTRSVRLEEKQLVWIRSRGASFNFSGWVRDIIDKEIEKGEA